MANHSPSRIALLVAVVLVVQPIAAPAAGFFDSSPSPVGTEEPMRASPPATPPSDPADALVHASHLSSTVPGSQELATLDESASAQVDEDVASLEEGVLHLYDLLDRSVTMEQKRSLRQDVAALDPETRSSMAGLIDALTHAIELRERAFAGLTENEQARLLSDGMDVLLEPTQEVRLDGQVDVVERTVTPTRSADTQHLADRVELAHLVEAALVLTQAAQDARSSPWGDEALPFEDPLGLVHIGTHEDETHDQERALVLDPAGNDTYTGNAGGAWADQLTPVALAVDLGGDDVYRSDRATVQGAGIGGVGVLLDFEGNDSYEARTYGQGAGGLGVGLLYDEQGDDHYKTEDRAQGYGFEGLGLLLDAEGEDTYVGKDRAQAVGFAAGVGALYDHAGADTYRVNYLGQAAGESFAATLLYDANGDDRYEAPGPYLAGYGHGSQAQAYASRTSASTLRDQAGDDVYEAGALAQAAAIRGGLLALLQDDEGQDTYDAGRDSRGFAQAEATALFRDGDGDATIVPPREEQSHAGGLVVGAEERVVLENEAVDYAGNVTVLDGGVLELHDAELLADNVHIGSGSVVIVEDGEIGTPTGGEIRIGSPGDSPALLSLTNGALAGDLWIGQGARVQMVDSEHGVTVEEMEPDFSSLSVDTGPIEITDGARLELKRSALTPPYGGTDPPLLAGFSHMGALTIDGEATVTGNGVDFHERIVRLAKNASVDLAGAVFDTLSELHVEDKASIHLEDSRFRALAEIHLTIENATGTTSLPGATDIAQGSPATTTRYPLPVMADEVSLHDDLDGLPFAFSANDTTFSVWQVEVRGDSQVVFEDSAISWLDPRDEAMVELVDSTSTLVRLEQAPSARLVGGETGILLPRDNSTLRVEGPAFSEIWASQFSQAQTEDTWGFLVRLTGSPVVELEDTDIRLSVEARPWIVDHNASLTVRDAPERVPLYAEWLPHLRVERSTVMVNPMYHARYEYDNGTIWRATAFDLTTEGGYDWVSLLDAKLLVNAHDPYFPVEIGHLRNEGGSSTVTDTDPGLVVQERTYGLVVEVVDANEEPVGQATVSFQTPEGEALEGYDPATMEISHQRVSDASGTVLHEFLPRDEEVLVTASAGDASASATTMLEQDGQEITLQLSDG